jgi:S1-C subfamily serine protease
MIKSLLFHSLKLLITGSLFFILFNFLNNSKNKYISSSNSFVASQVSADVASASSKLNSDETSNIELFQKAAPSVAYITSISVQRDFFTLNVFEIPQGAGSGFIWDTAGSIVTNFHVIKDAQAVKVTLSDRSSWDAKIVGVEVDKDLAVLKIDAPKEKLFPISVGTSENLLVGQKVLAIGNPFGFDHTLTTGVISGLGREISSLTGRSIRGVIQTDAAINPGNSGGPLLNSSGELIGMNTAIYSPSGAYAGIGFAVPVATISRLVPNLISGKKINKPTIGVKLVDDYIGERIGVKGAIIAEVQPSSPAEQVGLKPLEIYSDDRISLGDIIIGVNGKLVESADDLLYEFETFKAGDAVTLSLLRRGRKKQDLEITLR